jgi:hypothetical protein
MSDKKFAAWIAAEAQLAAVLENEGFHPKPSTPVLALLLGVLLRTSNDKYVQDNRERLTLLDTAVQQLDKARTLRNKSVIAHGFGGVSQEQILSELRVDETGLWEVIGNLLQGRAWMPVRIPGRATATSSAEWWRRSKSCWTT